MKTVKKVLLYGFTLYLLFGFLILPLILKSQIIKVVSSATTAQIDIESIYFNPLIFKLKVAGLDVNTQDSKPLLNLKSIELDVDLSSLLFSALHVKNFVLENPEISLVQSRDKTFNFSTILKTESKEPSPENNSSINVPRIIVDNIAIVDGKVNYEDYTHKSKFEFSLDKLGFNLKDIDTKDFNTSDASLRFYSTLDDGGFVDFKSEVVKLKPLVVSGSLNFEASKLYTQWKYMQDSLNLEVADGKLFFYTDYHFDMNDLNSTTLYNLSLNLDDLRIKPKHKYKDVLNLDTFYIKDATVKPLEQNIHVKKIGLEDLHVKVLNDSDGKIDWLEYIKNNTPIKEKTQEQNSTIADKEDSSPWVVLVEDMTWSKVKLDFDDMSIAPHVKSSINDLNITLKNATLEGREALSYEINLIANDKFTCNSKGELKHKILNLNSYTKCRGFDIAHYRPYIDDIAKKELKVYDLKLIRAMADFDANLTLNRIDSEVIAQVESANLSLKSFALNKASTKERLVNFKSFDVNGVKLNTKEKNLNIEKTTLGNLEIKSKRLRNGTLNLDTLVVPKKAKKVKKTKAKEKEYRVKLNHFALKSAKVGFDDRTLSPSVKSKVDRINFNAYKIDSKKNSWLKYDFSARVNSKGYAKSKGSLSHTPLKQKGSFELKSISLKELTPYIQESAFVELNDGYLSIKSKTSYEKSSNSPDIKINGSLNLREIFVNDSRDNSSLISFNNVGLKSFSLEMMPNRLYIDEIGVDSLYVNAVIDEKKTINFSDLMKKKDDMSDTNTTQTKEVKEPFALKIAKVNIATGSAKFADLSLPIKFRTHIHDLNGAIYSISNNPSEVSSVDIFGEVDEYGSTKLKGSINSSNPKAYTDLNFNFKNLELNSASGYSASFAGHKIDSGKLFLDLGYKIINSELAGENSIIINNIKLGEEYKDENITSLPLGFVIALLEDSDGVIDIEMPVEGNIDKPDFKYAALIAKTFVNLITKAVTSPFRFLGSMLGMDGEELESLDFDTGEMNILPHEREKLDKIAKIMSKRPKISLSVSPRYDAKFDKLAMQREKLISLVVKKSGIKNRQEHKNAMTIDMLEDIYEDIKDDDRLDKIEDELEEKYKDEEFERVYLDTLIKECTDIQILSLEELKLLATQRAEAIKEYLVNEKSINQKRVKLFDIAKSTDSSTKSVKTKLQVEVE